MKKCASCSKDLPDAALHCVFCGAKQAPSPAVAPSNAKTAFGYSANEVMQQLGRPATQPAPSGLAGTARPDAATQVAPTVPPAAAQAPYQQPYSSPPQQQPYPSPQQQAPAGAFAPYGAPPPGAGMGIHSPPQPTPAPLPTAPAPYLGAQTGVRAGRPIEPWKDSLKLWMIVWGAAALLAFLVPLNLSPLRGHWNEIADGVGTAKVMPLVWAAVALISLIVGLLPLESVGRGVIALLLGLAGIVTPVVLAEHHPWQELAQLAGLVLLIPGLLLRDEYVESMLARIMVTLGVIAFIAPYLVPAGGQLPLVTLFKMLIEAPGQAKIVPMVTVAHMVLVVMCLLAWMPGPATGGAKVFAWLLLLFPVVEFLIALALDGHIAEIAAHAPGMIAICVAPLAFTVLAGYGLATVLGKQLE